MSGCDKGIWRAQVSGCDWDWGAGNRPNGWLAGWGVHLTPANGWLAGGYTSHLPMAGWLGGTPHTCQWLAGWGVYLTPANGRLAGGYISHLPMAGWLAGVHLTPAGSRSTSPHRSTLACLPACLRTCAPPPSTFTSPVSVCCNPTLLDMHTRVSAYLLVPACLPACTRAPRTCSHLTPPLPTSPTHMLGVHCCMARS